MYEGVEEEAYVCSNFEAYQLKTISQIKKVEEVDWDNEDEDALILAHQPYETVMQIGFKDYLNHKSTKFIARRSDIIVSSTLSITMSPQNDMFIPCKFSKIKQPELNDYV